MAAGTKGRDPTLAIVLAVLAAMGLLVGGVQLLGVEDTPSGPPPLSVVLRPAQAWFRAWEADDREAMATLAGLGGAPRTEMVAALAGFREGLGDLERSGGKLQATPGTPTITGDRAVVPYDASVTLPGFGTWRYTGSIVVARNQGGEGSGDDEWRPIWELADLYPGLTPGSRLAFVVTWPQRAQLVLADGRPATGRVSSSIVGRTAAATEAQAAALGGGYRVGQTIGVSGLEASQERRLAGTPTAEVRLLQGETVLQVPYKVDGTPPAPATVTIDPRVQSLAQQALEGAPAGKLGALVAIQPSTGNIVAAASRPVGGYDRSLLGLYPPGSTFKVVTTLALLTKGLKLDETVPCPAQAVIGGRRFVNAEGEVLGQIPFRHAFAESCNTAFVQLAQRLSPAELHAMAESLGINRDPALGVPTSTSSVPMPEGSVDLAATSIGQGRVLVTPFQMAEVAASVAAGGYRPPRLVDTGPPAALVPFAPGVADATAEVMRLVVTEGTGRNARVEGTPVAGKTGTAEYGTEVPPRTHAWFIAFRGDLAIAVLVDDGGFGGDVAAPIAASFFRSVG